VDLVAMLAFPSYSFLDYLAFTVLIWTSIIEELVVILYSGNIPVQEEEVSLIDIVLIL